MMKLASSLLAGLLFCLVAGVVFWYALSHTVHLGTQSVPDLRGMEVAAAQRQTHDLGHEDGHEVVRKPGGDAAREVAHAPRGGGGQGQERRQWVQV